MSMTMQEKELNEKITRVESLKKEINQLQAKINI